MSVSKKSNIRSRWYRSNEKPLESNDSQSKPNEPMGEISITENEKFIDDLTLVKPISSRGDAHTRKQQSKEAKNRRKKNRHRNDTPNNTKDRETIHSKNSENEKPKSNSRKRKRSTQSKNRNPNQNNRVSKGQKSNSKKKISKNRSPGPDIKPKQSKLGKFISKIFGN